MLILGILLSVTISIGTVFSASCADNTWKIAYSGGNCVKSGGVYKIKCQNNWNPGVCGMRLDGKARIGKGTYTAKIKAAPGAGLNTAFYLFTYGRNNDKSRPWNEIDIELLGKQIYGGKTRLWTNVWTGHYVQHGKFVTLNFDASKGYHTYQIKIDGSKIYFRVDGSTKRSFKYTGFSDLKSTINNKNFQAEMVLWGANDNSWPDMGGMYNNGNKFPLYAYFKGVSINSAFTAEDETGGEALSWTVIFAIVLLGSACLLCAAFGGFYYWRKKRKIANGDGASFKQDDDDENEVEDYDEDEQELAPNTQNTPVGDEVDGDNNDKTKTGGYDMSPIDAEEIEVEVEVETNN